jgi:hypothetical protein
VVVATAVTAIAATIIRPFLRNFCRSIT